MRAEMTVRLSRRERIILRLLHKRGPVSTERICHVLWGTDPNGGPNNALGVIRVQLYLLRAKGIRVQCVERGWHSPSVYQIEPESMDLVTKVLRDYDAIDKAHSDWSEYAA